jgi:hypothetical protein
MRKWFVLGKKSRKVGCNLKLTSSAYLVDADFYLEHKKKEKKIRQTFSTLHRNGLKTAFAE